MVGPRNTANRRAAGKIGASFAFAILIGLSSVTPAQADGGASVTDVEVALADVPPVLLSQQLVIQP